MSDKQHKHYHFHLWPKMSDDVWFILCVTIIVLFSVHTCAGYG